MNRWIAAIAFLAGCDKLFGLDEIKVDGGAGDAGADAKVFLDAPPSGTVCAGGTNGAPLHMCAQQSTLQTRTLSANLDINTDMDAMCDRVVPASGQQPALCALMALDLSIAGTATITAHGTRPLVIVSMGTLTVSGTIDLSSHTGRITGAAANDASCSITNGGLPQDVGMSTSGGGAGGSFGTAGGDGGAQGGVNGGVAAQVPIDGSQLTVVRGGCRGGDGGHDHDGNFSVGGASGGAIYLMATTAIRVANGQVLANGAGGGGGMAAIASDFPGGAGGGAGGLIMLDSPAITLSAATLMANGGGGGGGQGTSASVGTGGNDPDPVAPLVGASGGTGGTLAGNGGTGSSLTAPTPGGSGTATGGAGGGGGGGAGVIRAFGPLTMTGSKIAPSPS